jgi:hypothetical protein
VTGHDTSRSSRVSPRVQDEIPTDPGAHQIITITADKIADYENDCASISDKSEAASELTDKDSDFGSECLSMANSSNRSEKQKKRVRIVNVRATDMTSLDENDDMFTHDLSADSTDLEPELDKLNSSCFSGLYGSISERVILYSYFNIYIQVCHFLRKMN